MLPEVKGKIDGVSLRVPTPDVSVVALTCVVNRATSADEVNNAFREAAKAGPLKGILRYTEDPIVSSDIQGDPHSSIFDAGLTASMGKMVKVLAWYDNEWGYSNRLIDTTLFAGAKVKRPKKR